MRGGEPVIRLFSNPNARAYTDTPPHTHARARARAHICNAHTHTNTRPFSLIPRARTNTPARLRGRPPLSQVSVETIFFNHRPTATAQEPPDPGPAAPSPPEPLLELPEPGPATEVVPAALSPPAAVIGFLCPPASGAARAAEAGGVCVGSGCGDGGGGGGGGIRVAGSWAPARGEQVHSPPTHAHARASTRTPIFEHSGWVC
jgi:hypothetical protein